MLRSLLPEGATIPGRLIDAFRAGTVPDVIRRKGAEGTLTLPEEDRAEILVFLTGDSDESVRKIAHSTLDKWTSDEWVRLCASPSTSQEVLDFAAGRLAAMPDEFAEEPPVEEAPAPTVPKGGGEEENKRETLLQRIGRMTTAQKIKTALTGSQDERLLLIRDSNKVVARAVLQSPKISDMEIENMASMKSVTEEVLRLIATNRKFMKSYGVMRQLINNPRTPIDVSLPLLNRLNERDLKGIMLNKNIPEVIRSMAVKSVKQKEEANKPKLPGKKH